MPKNWSVKSVYVSKLIICSYPEVIDGCSFDFRQVFNFVSIAQVVASQSVHSCTYESDFSKYWKIPRIFVHL